jgi:thiazole/oxazole-forming peptide maturase SagD family component
VNVRPILAVPAISSGEQIKFILPDQEIMLEKDITPDAWSILALCNGLNSVAYISEELTEIDDDFIAGFLDDLMTLGVVVDSRQVYQHFHAISSNPMVYASDITSEEIVAHTMSPRMAVKPGTAFALHSRDDSLLAKLQSQRTSCRSFTGEPLTTDEIGAVLDTGYSYSRHAVPSAGGLYPMKVFLIALNDQAALPAGYYEYDNENDQLVLFNGQPDPERIAFAFNDAGMLFGASVVLVIAADANRQPHKYSNRGYRYMAIEAGEITQNIVLSAVDNGLATCVYGGLQDSVISDELGLDGCLPFVAIALGKSADQAEPASTELLSRLEDEFLGKEKAVQRSWLLDDSMANNHGKSYFQFLAATDNGQITCGISTSWTDAKLKAIAEGYERQRSGTVSFDIRTSARELDGPWLDPRVVAPLSDEQYDGLPHLQKFDEDAEIEWIRGENLEGQPVYVPIDLVFYPIDPTGRKLIVDTCSSGFAAYTTREGAIDRGTLELIERDALMRSWYEQKSPVQIGLSALPTHLRRRISYWREQGREVYVLDLSRNGVIITEVVITSDEYPCFVSGASSSLASFDEAAVKAFHEAESRLIFGLNEPSTRTISPEHVHAVLDHELLYAQSRQYHEYVQFLFDGPMSDMAPVATAAISSLKQQLEIVIVDVSETNASLKVVKVLSPLMIPINFGYGTNHYLHHSLSRAHDASRVMPHYFA